ncbi:MAG: hypothetical protein KUG51_00630, partial [Urechidicola sp.]|nr:hypothetical protein [Urechidicola sp.]
GITFLIILASILVSIKINSLPFEFKKSWILILAHFLCALYMIVFSPIKNGSEMIFIFFPTAVMSTNFLQLINSKILKELIVYSMLMISLSVYFL